jgi:hypothetical protein
MRQWEHCTALTGSSCNASNEQSKGMLDVPVQAVVLYRSVEWRIYKQGSTIESAVGLTLVQGHGFCPFICCNNMIKQQGVQHMFVQHQLGFVGTQRMNNCAMCWQD